MPDALPTAADLARMSLAAQHPLTRGWVDDAARLDLLAEEHAFDLQLATDLELAGERAVHFRPALGAATFLNRWVTARPDLEAMLSLRFEGLDPEKPFVDASLTSRPVVGADLPALLAVGREVYGAFEPPRLRIWSSAPLEEWTAALPHLRSDQRVLAAPLAELRDKEVPAGLTLRPTRDLTHSAEAQAAYGAVDAAHPAHVGQARLLDEESLQQAIDARTMFDVLWQGEWSGYVATLPETQLGLPAQVVQELLLAPHARGRGFGPALSTLLARALPDDGRVLSGTIHGENRGAREAALRVGRHDVGGWLWVPLT